MPARVYSIDSIEAFRVALLKFQKRVEVALVELRSQMQHATDWIEHDRPAYWKNQSKLAEAAIHQAKINLEHCLIYRATDRRPACREEKGLLKKAQLRRDVCRDKMERVQHWKRTFHHQLFEYQGRISKLSRLLEHDLPQANAALKKILQQLEKYQLEQGPQFSQPPQGATPTSEPTEISHPIHPNSDSSDRRESH